MPRHAFVDGGYRRYSTWNTHPKAYSQSYVSVCGASPASAVSRVVDTIAASVVVVPITALTVVATGGLLLESGSYL